MVKVWNLQVGSNLTKILWNWDVTCSKAAVAPLANHTVDNVTWLGANLLEAGDSGILGPNVLGYHEGDSIFIDTTLILHSKPWLLHDVMAHELEHELLWNRVPVDSSVDIRVREVQDSIHPFFPFQYPCLLLQLDNPLPIDSLIP